MLFPFITNRNNKQVDEATFKEIDLMDGVTFERWCAEIIKKIGFNKVKYTPTTGDQGADIIAYKNNKKYVIQCKRHAKVVGNRAVQEVYSALNYYGGDIAVVMTNNYFSNSAMELAKKHGVKLIDRSSLDKLQKKVRRIEEANQ